MQDIELSEEHVMIRDMARDFARSEIAPMPRRGKKQAGLTTPWSRKWASWVCSVWWYQKNGVAPMLIT